MSERVLHEWVEDGKWIRQISADGKKERIRKGGKDGSPWSIWRALSIETEELARLAARVAELEAEKRYVAELYRELVFAVGRKYPGETRHETALRYIREAEAPHTDPDRDARAEVDNG